MVIGADLEAAAESHADLPDADEVYDREEPIPLSALFDDAFVAAHTDFETFDELVAASPSDADVAGDLGEVPSGLWDEFVAEHTDFADEEAFVMAARDNWVAKKLDLE
ncbi:hypothetical protein [Halopenitus persicus]|uniref:Uncharacterized protein n=1 Tax=Halopenitus persicus TaxID=1048396 RepID=A0A1H3K0P9_9EURY|nr:hypothetical protein [Halopenitus persicus]QHS15687.1 hypothetical protein GWK26_00180 [haloarchaeon 3A1-DGR]SDY45741.1 hypothetical protein SAMN05216564_105212 [Halopenitus persicus]